jgi:nitrogen-specific signal transduction histidine kinase
MENILAKALGQDATQLPVMEKRDLLARLLKRLAHEIRNPLSSLDVHFQLLEEDLNALSPAARMQLAARLGIIHGELHRLESIVGRFLKLAGPSALELEPVEIKKLSRMSANCSALKRRREKLKSLPRSNRNCRVSRLTLSGLLRRS